MSLEKYLIPFIGSKGFFEIKKPFHTEPGALFTCQSIRKISDYVANNEDLLELVYTPKGVTEDEFLADKELDMPIIALQSDTGYWHYFPARCLITYPDPNGVPYRKMGVYLSLPPMPVAKDLSFLIKDMQDLIMSTLGTASSGELVEASQVSLIPEEKHTSESIVRQAKANNAQTLYARIMVLETEKENLIQKIRELESYILYKSKPESYYTHVSKKDLGALIIDGRNKQDFRHRVMVPGMVTSSVIKP